MNYIQAFWMFALMGAWSSDLSLFSSAIASFSWIWSAINMCVYLPNIVFWHLSGPNEASKAANGWMYGFERASGWYSWLMTTVNIFLLLIMLLYGAILHTFVDGEPEP